jgi:hypothetical protein
MQDSPPPPAPQQQQQPPAPSGMDAFPSLDSPAPEVRVTGMGGTGDQERDEFENAFPDLTSEVPYEAVSGVIIFSRVQVDNFSSELSWRNGTEVND